MLARTVLTASTYVLEVNETIAVSDLVQERNRKHYVRSLGILRGGLPPAGYSNGSTYRVS